MESISGSRAVISDEGSGLPPIQYITERGPFQHGESIKDFFLGPRTVQFLIRQNYCSRQAAWDGRQSLLNLIRPNKPGGPQGVLRKILPNGARRDLRVVPVAGPVFEPRRTGIWDEWSIQETLRFTAYNPIYYDPVGHTETWQHPASTGFPYTFTFPFSVPNELSFPIEYPIEFYGFHITDVIHYAGNWLEYPRIVIHGPAAIIEIINTTTDERILISGPDFFVEPGRYAIIDLTYSIKTVTMDDGTTLESYVSDDSDVGTFHLEPGDNNFTVIVHGAGLASQVVMTWKDRYIGI